MGVMPKAIRGGSGRLARQPRIQALSRRGKGKESGNDARFW